MRFRLRPESRYKSIALRMWHVGASEVYVDGIRIASFGIINTTDPSKMQGYVPQFEFLSVDPVLATREPNVDHVIAIRFQSSPFVPAEMIGGYKNVVPLSVWIGRTQELTQYYGAFRAQYDIRILIPLGLVVALGLLHLFAYVFDRRSTVNLYYVAYAFTFASIVTCWTIIEVSTDPEIVFWSGFLINVLWTVVDVAAVYLVTKLLQGAVRGWRAWTFPALAIVVWTAPMLIPIGGNTLWGFFTLVCFVDILVQVIGALRRRHEAAVFIGIGMTLFFVYVLTWFFGFYLEMVAIDRSVWRVIFIAGVTGFPVMTSFYLARRMARTNRQLRVQLDRVEELTRQQILGEQRDREIRGARELQLSMLPQAMPSLAHLKMSVVYDTATEVGGDYYDYYIHSNTHVTVAIGDATGHGLRAGTMVAAVKSHFQTYAVSNDQQNILLKMDTGIRNLRLRGLYMCMGLLTVNGSTATWSSAGIPPLLWYHAADGTVELVTIKGLPLGAPHPNGKRVFREQSFIVASGDVLVALTDGLPELCNTAGQYLGLQQVIDLLTAQGEHDIKSIADSFAALIEQWNDVGENPNDDITIVVLRIR
jgi:serine phosphatase RsbU (regulator of sigma subunit)